MVGPEKQAIGATPKDAAQLPPLEGATDEEPPGPSSARRWVFLGLLVLLVPLAVVGALAVVGSDDDVAGDDVDTAVGFGSDGGGGTRSELSAELRSSAQEEDVELSESQANCIADVFIDAFGEDTVQNALDADEEAGDAMMDAAFEELSMEASFQIFGDMAECAPELMGDMMEGESDFDLEELESDLDDLMSELDDLENN